MLLALLTAGCGSDAKEGEPGDDGSPGDGSSQDGNAEDGSAGPGDDGSTGEDGSAADGDPSDGEDGDGNPNPGNGSYAATLIDKPEGAYGCFGMAFNDEGDVLVACAVDSFTKFDTLFVTDGESATKVPPPAGFVVDVNGLNAGACINNQGKVGFNAKKDGAQRAAWYDGTESVEIDFGAADPASIVVTDCNDAGTVLGRTASGTEAHIWKDGVGSPVAMGSAVIGNFANGITEAGLISFTYGYNVDGAYADYPADSGFAAGAGLNSTPTMTGMIIDLLGGTSDAAMWTLGDAAPTRLPKVEGYANPLLARGISDEGVVIVTGTEDGDIWALAGDAYTKVVVEGYELDDVRAVNAKGWILATAEVEGNAALLLLKPNR
jgi:hypothetical protein